MAPSCPPLLRVYVPFGEQWYDYSVRRLRENPQIAGYAFKAMFQRATAACFSNPVSLQQTTGTDLLMLTPSLTWFAQKSAELVAQGLRSCGEVHSHVSEKVEQLKKMKKEKELQM